MFYNLLSDITVCLFALIAAAAAYSDVKRLIIPNSYSLSIVILYPAFVFVVNPTPDWLFSLGIATAALTLGFIFFALKYCGGGDAKLFAAVCLWAGPNLFVDFLIITTFTGGIIAASMWFVNRTTLMTSFLPQGSGGSSQNSCNKSMPYGAAIALGAVYVAFTLLR